MCLHPCVIDDSTYFPEARLRPTEACGYNSYINGKKEKLDFSLDCSVHWFQHKPVTGK